MEEQGNSTNGRRLKVLLIAYACEPDRGSEPGTGWNTALRLATRHEVTVATRANNRGPVETALTDIAEGIRPRFLYIDPPAWTLRLKSRRVMPTQIFYYFWQREVARHLGSSGERYDILHQLTFNSFEIPPLVFRRVPGVKIWGPVGGGQMAPKSLLEALGPIGTIKEAWRNHRVRLSAKTPWVRRTLRSCDMVLFANAETHALLGENCKERSGMMIDVGVDAGRFQPVSKKIAGAGVTFLAAGRLEPRKGMILVIEAFAAMASEYSNIQLRIVGDGPERSRLEATVTARSLEKRVTLTGAVSHEAMRRELEKADVFVFPSLRDTSGAVVLEAMAMALPIICLDHQGGAQMVGEDRGLRIPVSTHQTTIDSLRNAMIRLVLHPELRHDCGTKGRQWVAATYDWDIKAARFSAIYREIVAGQCNKVSSARSSPSPPPSNTGADQF